MSDSTVFPRNYIDEDNSRQHGRRKLEDDAPIDAAQATPGSYQEPGQSLSFDEIRAPEAAFAWDHDIRIGGRDFASSAQRNRPMLVIGALWAGLAVGLIGEFRFLIFAPASTAIEHKADCSVHELDSDEASCVAAKSDREAILRAPTVQKVAAPAATTSDSGNIPSRSANQQATASTNAVTLTQQNTASPRPRAMAIQHGRSVPRPAPVPETKPSTIEGWVVREVVGETAVLEGPNGQWRATSGDTVPGLGKVDSVVRWGSRWIVATSKGLVSTP
jgi:hypothetical protein